MKFSEIKNEQAIEALANMFDPIVEIASDAEIVSAARSNDKVSTVKLMLKNHSRAVFELLAASEGVDPDEYECNMLTLPMKLLELLNQSELGFLFPSQSQKIEPSFGSATGSTEDAEK